MHSEILYFFKNAFFFLFEKRFSPLQFCLTVVQIKVLLVQDVILLTLDTSQSSYCNRGRIEKGIETRDRQPCNDKMEVRRMKRRKHATKTHRGKRSKEIECKRSREEKDASPWFKNSKRAMRWPNSGVWKSRKQMQENRRKQNSKQGRESIRSRDAAARADSSNSLIVKEKERTATARRGVSHPLTLKKEDKRDLSSTLQMQAPPIASQNASDTTSYPSFICLPFLTYS